MRGWIGVVLGAMLCVGAGAARAQDWTVQQPPDGSVSAVQCLPNKGGGQVFTSLCVSVGCEAGAALSFGIGHQQIDLPPETRVKIAVDGRRVAEAILVATTGDTGRSMPIETQGALLGGLRGGRMARIELATAEGRRDFDVPLSGSRAAIDAALAACLVAGEIAGDPPVAPVSDDPAQDVAEEVAADCRGSGGAFTVEVGFASPVDLDGDGLDDLILDYGGLRCDGTPRYCGSGGCTQEVWLAESGGMYRQVLSDLIVRIEHPAPGRLRVVRDGAVCGRSGAEICVEDYAVEGGALVPLP
jgi:hypothetical protein